MILALGTAQLGGLRYGVNNSIGGLTDDQAAELLTIAKTVGFTAVDVSSQYGEAQRRVDDFLSKNPGTFEVLRRGDPGYESVYTDAEAYSSETKTIQLPANCLDGRMDAAIPRLRRSGVRVVVRSLLLQGLLTAGETGPVGNTGNGLCLEAALPYLYKLRIIAASNGLSVLGLAVRWAWQLMPDVALFGAETEKQVRQIGTHWFRGPLPMQIVQAVMELRNDIPELVISPRMWGQNFDFTA